MVSVAVIAFTSVCLSVEPIFGTLSKPKLVIPYLDVWYASSSVSLSPGLWLEVGDELGEGDRDPGDEEGDGELEDVEQEEGVVPDSPEAQQASQFKGKPEAYFMEEDGVYEAV
jgi:hypothetical protein|mmetsp:Transcript_48200/g.81143  ORF Transcript_48200/g.81143 Transcript_48200/m.81143 type:complete len:113 (-) Transcript_48200:859-1197(-)